MKETIRSKLTSFDLANFKIMNNFDMAVYKCVSKVTFVDVRIDFYAQQTPAQNCLEAIHREFATKIVDRIECHA